MDKGLLDAEGKEQSMSSSSVSFAPMSVEASTLRFFVGVTYAFAACFVYAKWPQYFFLMYALSFFLLVPLLYETQSPEKRGAYKEFCWYANFMALVFLFVDLFTGIANIQYAFVRQWLFQMSWVTATGVLAVMAIFNNNELSFHRVAAFGETFIHVFPTLVMYTVRWDQEALRKAFPSMFENNDLRPMATGDFWLAMFIMYLPWWSCYCTWASTCGLRRVQKDDLEKPGEAWRTDFFAMVLNRVREGSKMLNARRFYTSSDAIVLPEVLVYMFIHAIWVVGLLPLVSLLCFHYQEFHIMFNLVVVGRSIWNGAQRLARLDLASDRSRQMSKANDKFASF